MSDDPYTVIAQSPNVTDYCYLRAATGLSPKTTEAAAQGLAGTWFGVSVIHQERVVGMGRIIGDGGCFFQIVDIAVLPEHQGKGLGKRIMQGLVTYLEQHAPPSAYVSLIADGPARHLYEQYGFRYTAPASVGMYRFF